MEGFVGVLLVSLNEVQDSFSIIFGDIFGLTYLSLLHFIHLFTGRLIGLLRLFLIFFGLLFLTGRDFDLGYLVYLFVCLEVIAGLGGIVVRYGGAVIGGIILEGLFLISFLLNGEFLLDELVVFHQLKIEFVREVKVLKTIVVKDVSEDEVAGASVLEKALLGVWN